MVQIFVKSVDRTFVVNVDATADVVDLKAAIEDVEYVPAECMRLVAGSKTLTGALCLSQDETVEMLLDVSGGMRAKWRKKRMRRLRRKRRKMRQRAK
mmetsp:Transcript_87612/g.212520  ORF Transcript_87612/g.212520 Transcript_87612/m.212520 type:complete len:97 (+) Transcript_87612:111-401(+)